MKTKTEILQQLDNGERMLRQLAETFVMVADSIKEMRSFLKENVDG